MDFPELAPAKSPFPKGKGKGGEDAGGTIQLGAEAGKKLQAFSESLAEPEASVPGLSGMSALLTEAFKAQMGTGGDLVGAAPAATRKSEQDARARVGREYDVARRELLKLARVLQRAHHKVRRANQELAEAEVLAEKAKVREEEVVAKMHGLWGAGADERMDQGDIEEILAEQRMEQAAAGPGGAYGYAPRGWRRRRRGGGAG